MRIGLYINKFCLVEKLLWVEMIRKEKFKTPSWVALLNANFFASAIMTL